MKFGFVTYENANDAYRAIDCSSGDATINMYDISFGGRRAFCKATYMDLGTYTVDRIYKSYRFCCFTSRKPNGKFILKFQDMNVLKIN